MARGPYEMAAVLLEAGASYWLRATQTFGMHVETVKLCQTGAARGEMVAHRRAADVGAGTGVECDAVLVCSFGSGARIAGIQAQPGDTSQPGSCRGAE